jgi:hypothetical protein
MQKEKKIKKTSHFLGGIGKVKRFLGNNKYFLINKIKTLPLIPFTVVFLGGAIIMLTPLKVSAYDIVLNQMPLNQEKVPVEKLSSYLKSFFLKDRWELWAKEPLKVSNEFDFYVLQNAKGLIKPTAILILGGVIGGLGGAVYTLKAYDSIAEENEKLSGLLTECYKETNFLKKITLKKFSDMIFKNNN